MGNIDLNLWIQETLKPAIFDRANEVFPQLYLTSTANGWKSRYKLDGTLPALDRQKGDEIILDRRYGGSVFIANGGDDNKETIKLYKDLNHIQGGNIEAIKAIAKLLGLSLPSERTPEEIAKIEKAQARQEELQASLKRMQRALSSKEGEQVLNYLRNTRKYNSEFIEFAKFGYVSPEEADKIGELFPNREGKKGFSSSLAKYYPLAIPLTSRGRLYGFKFRVIGEPPTKRDGSKMSKYYNIGGISTNEHLFGLSDLPTTSKDKNTQNLIVVEGEIDCLRMRLYGFNAVASLGSQIKLEPLQEAKRKGVKSLTLLYDGDGGGRTFTEATIKTASKLGLSVYVAELPKGIKDPDSFFQEHKADEMAEILRNAIRGCTYLFYKIIEEFQKNLSGKEEATDIEVDELKAKIIELIVSLSPDPTEKTFIFRAFEEMTGNLILEKDLQQIASKEEEALAAKTQEKELENLSRELSKLVGEGKKDEALELLKEEPQHILSKKNVKEFSSLLNPISRADFIQSIKEEGEPLVTPYVLDWQSQSKQEEVAITFPSGAVTLVCAPTGHGKSTLLRNFALDILTRDQAEGDILYFTYEESREDVICQFINTYHGKAVHAFSKTHKQIDAIKDYFKTGVPHFFVGCDSGRLRSPEFEAFHKDEEEFFSKYIETGKLRPFYKDYDITTLLEALRYAYENVPKIKAIFIDYVQLLRKTGNKATRQDELQAIMNSISAFAVETKLPIIMASQLNREASTPLRMTNQNLSESSYLEKSANTILCCWNSKYKAPFGRNSVGGGEEQAELDHLKNDLDFELGKAGKLFVKMTKRRGGTSEVYSVFDFEQALGKVIPNSTEEPRTGRSKEEPSEEDKELLGSFQGKASASSNLSSSEQDPLGAVNTEEVPF